MTTNKETARAAGLVYLVVVLTGIFSLMYVPSKLIVWDDAAATVSNIVAAETLFRFGIVSALICYTAFLFLPLVLYKLLKPVDKTMATLMVVLAVAGASLSFLNVQNEVDVVTLLGDGQYLKALSAQALQTEVMLALDAHYNGIRILEIFWGLWLLPFGYLVFKSGFLPKLLGIFLMAGCFGYLINFLGHFLVPDYRELGIASFVELPSSIGELGICLWLLIMGAKDAAATAEVA